MSTPREQPARPPATNLRNGSTARGADGRFRPSRAERAGAARADTLADDPGAASSGLDEVIDPVPQTEADGPAAGAVQPVGSTAARLADDDEPPAPPLPEDRFLNRELSWLDFNARVLTLAEDQRTPLLERAKFLAIFASNLDEFYMVRIAGLKRRLSAGLPVRGGDRLPLRTQLELIAERTAARVARHAA
ncbi:RNA degradosome polyphosphate kinase, partial [Micromonospora sp. M51]|nr:RNA degradosome polyphosphate kinase [Micromonospora sp. M51]